MMEREIQEVPQVDVPDEITQVDLPEIGETTPHPRVPDPQASQRGAAVGSEGGSTEPIGFVPAQKST